MEENKVIETVDQSVDKIIEEVKENTICKDFESSESLSEFIPAMLKFHKSMGAVTKDATNPFYKNTYVSLSKLCKEINPKLNEAGLFIMQLPMEDKEQGTMFINTKIFHESGQWMSFNCCGIKKGRTAQDIIGDSTYLKRASLTSLLLIVAEEDDDGEENRKSISKESNDNSDNSQTQTTSNTPTRRRRG